MSILRPTTEEQEQFNEDLEKAPTLEKCKIGFITLPIDEYNSIHCAVPADKLAKFYMSFSQTILTKKRNPNSIGSQYAFALLARAYAYQKKSQEGGKRGMKSRWNKKEK